MWPDSSQTQELLAKAQAGDTAARNQFDASDIVQDVLVEADRRLAG